MNSTVTVLLVALFSWVYLPSSLTAQQINKDQLQSKLIKTGDYTYGYWLNGRRKSPTNLTPDVLCFESGHFALQVNLDDFKNIKYSTTKSNSSYLAALDTRHTNQLQKADLSIEIDHAGQTYTATSTRAGRTNNLSLVRLFESGRFFQHFDILGLEFTDTQGRSFPANGSLDIKIWPQHLQLTSAISPSYRYKQGGHIGKHGNGFCVISETKRLTTPSAEKLKQFSIETWFKIPSAIKDLKNQYILTWGAMGKPGFTGIKINPDRRLIAEVFSGSTTQQIREKNFAVTDNQWHHVVVSYDGSSYKLFLDGELQRSIKPQSAWVPPLHNVLQIGGRGSSNTHPGVYDSVIIRSSPLSEQEIKLAYHGKLDPSHHQHLFYKEDFEEYTPPKIENPIWNDATIRITLTSNNKQHTTQRTIAGEWKESSQEEVSLHIPVSNQPRNHPKVTLTTKMNYKSDITTDYNTHWQCYKSTVTKIQRPEPSGYTDIRYYDDFKVTVHNDLEKPASIPFMIDHYSPANITGVAPILCDALGNPLGYPLQISKNWHLGKDPNYVKIFTKLPCLPGKNEFTIRLAYGFYGTLPSASHAQLSLVDYRGNARWDQLAIGCWGETICFDMDQSCVDNIITDVRTLTTRNGKLGKKWSWTDAGWGGDWLQAYNQQGGKLYLNGTKTAYNTHGPCLTDVHSQGFFGENKEVTFKSKIQTTRTDDHARTFIKLKYTINQKLSTDKLCFLKMGSKQSASNRAICYGNQEGLLKEITLDHKNQPYELPSLETISGPPPWWIGKLGNRVTSNSPHSQQKGGGNRAFVITKYRANINGKEYHNPSFSVLNTGSISGLPTSEVLLTPPAGISSLLTGDTIEIELVWITIPQKAEDYYGSNNNLKEHLLKNPDSWKNIYREASGNNLNVVSKGGKVLSNYPLFIEATSPQISLSIEGGIGAVPITFQALKHLNYKLVKIENNQQVEFSQAVHGNDFRQTQYNPSSQDYSITYNIPLDGLVTSQWKLLEK